MTSVRCVGAVIVESAHLLLVQRGHDPFAGRWSLPGGRVQPGESDPEALRREVREETGLTVTVQTYLGRVQLPGPFGSVYDVADYRCVVDAGRLQAADDAADARWASAADLRRLELTPDLPAHLGDWGVLDLLLAGPAS